jgi:phosphoglycolate phosphatase-like HAD superfamily hydrolase
MITIAWDVDDVLNDLMRCWFREKWLPDHQEYKKSYEDLKENPPHRILGVSLNEYLKSLDEYRLSGRYTKIEPVKEVLDWFSSYGKRFRHIALTAVPFSASSVSAQWVIKNFGEWIRTFHFVPSKRHREDLPEYEKDKKDFLQWFGKVDVFIDDNTKNINSAKKSGVKVILMPRPWNNQSLTTKEVLNSLIQIKL